MCYCLSWNWSLTETEGTEEEGNRVGGCDGQ